MDKHIVLLEDRECGNAPSFPITYFDCVIDDKGNTLNDINNKITKSIDVTNTAVTDIKKTVNTFKGSIKTETTYMSDYINKRDDDELKKDVIYIITGNTGDVTHMFLNGKKLLGSDPNEPLKFTCVDNESKISYNYQWSTLYYSMDKVNWERYSAPNTITLSNNESVYFKGENYSLSGKFNITGNTRCDGNIMSLLGEYETEIKSSNCFENLFSGCASLMSAPELPATTLTYACYYYMFRGCTKLTSAPALPATTLASSCYNSMFSGCTSLTNAPSILPATTLANSCYAYMFDGCTSLTSAPSILPATTLADNCYDSMFEGCASLTSAPALPATTLASSCYQFMFSGCTKLTSAPELPATTLANRCYYYMFRGCTKLTSAPALPATTLADNCYSYMFYGCRKLNYIKAMFTTTPSDTYTQNWVSGVASTGTFVKNELATWDVTGLNGVPSGWTVETEYEIPLLKFTASGASTLGLTNYYSNAPVLYKSTDGITWESWNYSIISLADGASVYIKGDNPNGLNSSTSKYSMFTMTGSIACDGNVMGLLGEDVTDIPYSYCFYSLFNNCRSLTSAPALPATTLTDLCYSGMFYGCTSLTSAPALSATTLTNKCYESMFRDCTSLTSAPALPATTLANYCYSSMFSGCTSLRNAPSILPATTLAYQCYNSMFEGCTSLKSAPELPATTLADNCYQYMFDDCTKLTNAPSILPATTLANSCYAYMFDGCTSLTSAPALPATTLANSCYYHMFFGCINVNYIKAMFTTTPSTTYTYSWVYNVAPKGTFIKNSLATWNVTGVNGVPNGWTVETEYEIPLLKFTASGASTIGLTNYGSNAPVLYKSTDGVTWESWDYSTISLADGASVYIKGDNPNGFNSSVSKYSTFTMTGSIACEGNVMGLLGEDVTDIPCSFCYYSMFYNCTSLTSVPELPATTLADACYYEMFAGCTSLTSTPELPAITLANSCYYSMFEGCTSLTNAPELPATTLASGCYQYMFRDCTKLMSAPSILPATTLADDCYQYMFNGCASLTSAPALPATTLTNNCYQHMFQGCTKLTSAPELPATTLASYCYYLMFSGCTSLTSAPELPATTLANNCYAYIFDGCTKLMSAPSILPATTLANNCYYYMFRNCTSLTSAPELPATTLANDCYNGMFYGCRKLNYIKAMFTTTPSTTYTTNWVFNVAPKGTFIKNGLTTWDVIGIHGVPSGWTVETEYETPLLKFTASGASTLGLTNNGGNAPVLYKSTDGVTWETWDYSTISLADGASAYIKGDNPKGFSSSTSKYSTFTMTGSIACDGNVMGLLGEDVTDIPCSYCYQNIFSGCTSLTSAPELPATTLTYQCYYYMFNGCTSLTSAPALPATTLANHCYDSMFAGCTSLTSAPSILPATTLANSCYYRMFAGCTSLTSAPELPATTLADYCYQSMFADCTSLTSAPSILPATTLANYCYCGMFRGCRSLTSAPKLPATTLVDECYSTMFYGCRKLNYIKAMFTTTPSTTYTDNWVSGVAPTGNFIKNKDTSWDVVRGVDGIPNNWEVWEFD